MKEIKLMTQGQEREYHASHPTEKRHNKFAKDGLHIKHMDSYSRMKSVMAQLEYQIEEKKRIAREEEAKKRAAKKNKEEGEIVDGN